MAIEEVLRIIDQGSPALKSVAAEAGKASVALDKVEDSASDFGRASAQLRGSLSLLSPELGEAAGVANDLFDALEVGSQAAKGAGLSLGSIGAVAGPVAVAVAALAAVYVVLNSELEAAEANAKAAADRATEMQEAVEQWKGSVAALNAEFDVANGAMTVEQAATAKRIAQLREQRAAQEALLQAEYDRASAATAATGATLEDSAAAARAGAQLRAYQQDTEDLTTKIELLAEKRTLDKEASDAAAASAKAGAAADKAEAAAARELAARYAADEAEIRAALAARAEERKQTEAVMLLAAESEMAALEEQRRAVEELAQAEKDRAEAAKANTDSAIRSTAAGVTGGPQAGVNALGEAGPWGELLASLIEMVTNLADTLGGFQDYHNQLMTAIGSLPQTLADNMGSIFSDSFATIIPDFVDSFTEAFPEIIGGIIGGIAGVTSNLLISMMIELPIALVKGILSIFTADFWIGIGESIAEAFTGIFKGSDTLDAAAADARSSSGMSKSGADSRDAAHAKRGSYDTGTSYVPETGLYQLHKGEEVINPTGMGTSRQEAMRGRVTSSRLGSSATGMVVHATIQLDSGALEQGLQDMRSRGYGV